MGISLYGIVTYENIEHDAPDSPEARVIGSLIQNNPAVN